MKKNIPRYTKKLVLLHVPFLFLRFNKMHVNLSSLTNTCKSARSKVNTQQLEEHDPGIIRKSLYALFLPFWLKNKCFDSKEEIHNNFDIC